MNIHRAAESSRILGSGNTWMFVVRVGFAGIMMFPLGNGFSAGQGLVYQSAMWGIGMAKVLYTNAIQAVGPDAVVIAQPMVPGTEQVILGLIDNELCADLVNLASNTSNMVPPPTPMTGTYPSGGGYSTFNYALSVGNQSGTPACGTVTIQTPAGNQATIAGQPVDMAAIQQAALNDVLNGSIRGPVQQVAQNLWQNKTVASLVPLQGILTSATQAYTRELTAAATSVQSAINTALQSQATQARNGNIDLLQGQVQQSTLGWTAAGSYYLEIAKANATTLSLLTATPVVTPPSYDGLGPALSQDLAPLEAASKDFLNQLQIAVQTQDSTSPPSGMPQTLAGAQDNQAQSLLTRLFTSMNLTTPLLNSITGFILPTGNMWRDPFGGLMAMGQTLIITSMIAFGTAALLSSSTISTGSAIFNFLTGNWGAAAASVARNAVMSFLGDADLPRPARAHDPRHPDRLRAADDPLGHVDGRRLRLDHPGLRGDDRRAALDARPHDRRRRRAARPGHRGLGPAVQRRVPADADGDRPVPRLLRLRLHELADPAELRHRRRLRAQQRLAGHQLHRRRRAADHLRDDAHHGRPDVVPDGRPDAAPPAAADRLHRRQPGRYRSLLPAGGLGARGADRRRGSTGLARGREQLQQRHATVVGGSAEAYFWPAGDGAEEGGMDSTLRAATDTSGPEEEADV